MALLKIYNNTTQQWVTIGSAITGQNFTHTANSSVSGNVTVTFADDTRGSRMITVSGNVNITFAVNNLSDNYLWIYNSGSTNVNVTIAAITSTAVTINNIFIPTDGISIDAGKVCEIGIIVNSDGAFLTSRSDLSALF